MDLNHPLAVVAPSLDGDVLTVLASGDVNLTGREIGRRIGASQEGVRRVLDRLARQGIVLRQAAGKAHLFRLNREHLAAPPIEQLAGLRQTFVARLRQMIQQDWSVPPAFALLFGSFARGVADVDSDIDLLIVRPAATDDDDPIWRRQLLDLSRRATGMTGNDARIVEYSIADAQRERAEGLFATAYGEGIALGGSIAHVRPGRLRRRLTRT